MRSIGIGAPRLTEVRSAEGNPAPAINQNSAIPRGRRFCLIRLDSLAALTIRGCESMSHYLQYSVAYRLHLI